MTSKMAINYVYDDLPDSLFVSRDDNPPEHRIYDFILCKSLRRAMPIALAETKP
jgi:hypothetical protein